MNSMTKLEEKLSRLKLKTMVEKLSAVLEQSKQKNYDMITFLEHLVDMELETRHLQSVHNRFQQSKLYESPTIDQFDFNFHPSRKKNRNRIMSLYNLDFIEDKKDVIFIGNTGTGKSFLTKCITYQCCLNNIKVLFTSAMDMINHLTAAKSDNSLIKKLRYYQSPVVLCIDELGFLPLHSEGANLFFQVISARHERKCTIITTNLPFSDWGNIFDSTTIAAAIADRLVANSEIVVMEGQSYRKNGKKSKRINHTK